MKNKPSALFWALSSVVLILVGIAFSYVWQLRQPDAPTTHLVNVGDLEGHAGRRLVKTTIVLEVSSKKFQEQIAERMTRTRMTIAASFLDFPESRIMTPDGKLELQDKIRDNLNDYFGPNAVREVLFTNFVVSIS